MAGRPDIRTGVDFEAVKGRDYRSVSPELKAIWKWLREVLPGYGFGRAELLPIRKTGEAVASYVAKYIEKNICNHTAADRGMRLVRYIGWKGKQLKASDFGWGTKGGDCVAVQDPRTGGDGRNSDTGTGCVEPWATLGLLPDGHLAAGLRRGNRTVPDCRLSGARDYAWGVGQAHGPDGGPAIGANQQTEIFGRTSGNA
jgi:hypothetical protein